MNRYVKDIRKYQNKDKHINVLIFSLFHQGVTTTPIMKEKVGKFTVILLNSTGCTRGYNRPGDDLTSMCKSKYPDQILSAQNFHFSTIIKHIKTNAPT